MISLCVTLGRYVNLFYIDYINNDAYMQHSFISQGYIEGRV